MRKVHYITPNWHTKKIKAVSTTQAAETFQQEHQDLAKHTETLINEIEAPGQPQWLTQVHGARALKAPFNRIEPEADASFTTTPNTVLAVRSADCLPILLCNQDNTEVAAIHAGWRSQLGGIITNTVNALTSKPETLMAWLGPAIGPTVYEVGDEVRVAFLEKSSDNSAYFTALKPGKWLMDLYGLARHSLNQCGVTTICGGDFCTLSDERFFSHRRDGKAAGRMATLIWIEESA